MEGSRAADPRLRRCRKDDHLRASPAKRGPTAARVGPMGSFSWYNAIGLCAAVCFALFPVLWLLSSTFKPWYEFAASPPVWITSRPTLENYRNVFYPFIDALDWWHTSSWRSLISSGGIAIVSTVIAMAVSIPAAFAIARYRTGGATLPFIILSFRMAPAMAIAIPMALAASFVGLKEHLISLPLLQAAYSAPLAVWLLKTYIERVPVELEEAAMLDGRSRAGAHFRVTLPLMRSGLATTTVFVFLLNYGEGALSIALAAGPWAPVPVQLAAKFNNGNVQAALAMLAAAPLIVIGYTLLPLLARGVGLEGAIRR